VNGHRIRTSLFRDTDLLAEWGFTPPEIASLLWLRQWYQTGGSDRANMVRHLELLRLLVETRRPGRVGRAACRFGRCSSCSAGMASWKEQHAC
jgi:hypothetical protein